VIGEGDVLVTKSDSGPSHVLDWAAAVRPVRVHVAVAAQCTAKRQRVVRNRRGFRFETLQVRGCRSRQRLLDDPRGDRPDARKLVKGAAPGPLLELRVGKRANDRGRVAKGTYAVGRFAFAFEDVRNALQGCDGVVAACQLGWAVRIDASILRLRSPELRLRPRPLTAATSLGSHGVLTTIGRVP
jgi:hypothetical protein